MKLLAELHDSDFDIRHVPVASYQLYRRTVRAIVMRQDALALEYSAKNNFYTLPGGGIEDGEPLIATLEREVLEETGYHISKPQEIGLVIEYSALLGKMTISYCFKAAVIGPEGARHLTEEEQEFGSEIRWVPLEKAIAQLEHQLSCVLTKPVPPEHPDRAIFERFSSKRDLIYLFQAQRLTKEIHAY